MTNYYWLVQSERYITTESDGRKKVQVKLTPTFVTNTSTPPYGVLFNGSGLMEILVGSLNEVLDFTVDRQYMTLIPSYSTTLQSWKDMTVPTTSGALGLATQTSKNGIVLLALKMICTGVSSWVPIASGDLAASTVLFIEAIGI